VTLFTREDLAGALEDLIFELRAAGETVGIRLVGGSALALQYFERGTTRDVDALHVRPGTDEAVAAAAHRVAERRGWDDHWFNFEVTKSGGEPLYGRGAEWVTVYEEADIVIQVASVQTLLAMELRANRPGRDTDDIRQLLALCEITTVDGADSLYREFYSGDSLSDRAWRMVVAIFENGPLEKPITPEPISLRPTDDSR
jgi:hypothetical protein